MRRNVIETVLGAVVLIVAVVFLGFSYSSANVGNVDGYHVTADFTGTGGLGVGDDVVISGVKIGDVQKIELNPDTYRARITMNIANTIKLPDDSSAFISSTSLLGGKYMELQPGGSEDMLANGGHIEYTQAPQNLEQLLGKFIFSMDKGAKADDDADDDQGTAASSVPATIPTEPAAPQTPAAE